MDLFHKGKENLLVGITDGNVSAIPICKAIKFSKKFDIKTAKILRDLSV
jgi:hypothetical protein